MIKGFKVRLFPNEVQTQLLWKHINVSRFVWNYALAEQLNRYKNGEKYLNKYGMRNIFIELKQSKEYAWLKEVSAHTIGNICIDLDKAYASFFTKIGGKPKFKKKNKCKNAFPVRCETVYFINNCVNIEKVGKIKYQSDKELPQGRNICKFTNPRIVFENNKWILSFGMECENQAQKLNDFSVGIDLGIKELAVVAYNNNHKVYKNINKSKRVKTLKHKLVHLQHKVSRKYETNNRHKVYDAKWYKSNGILKTEEQIRKICNQLSNIRKNYIHQTTHKIISLLPKRVVMEDLNVKGMMKNKHLAKAIAEQMFYEFIRQMKYKCEYNGIEFIQVDRFYPSSKTCHKCGCIKHDLKLSDRTYICPGCGEITDRDLNAAINLANYSKV
ncbi:MAG: transposase [Ruminococcus sp.]|nr:transposase [Ruminococcus sp.]